MMDETSLTKSLAFDMLLEQRQQLQQLRLLLNEVGKMLQVENFNQILPAIEALQKKG